MPDIAMCLNKECPVREKCYRAMAEPNFHQNYIDFQPRRNGCGSFVELVNDDVSLEPTAELLVNLFEPKVWKRRKPS